MICTNCTKKATHGTREDQVPRYCASCAKDSIDLQLRNLSSADCQSDGCSKYANHYINDKGAVVATKSKRLATFCRKHVLEQYNTLDIKGSNQKEETKPAAPAVKQTVSVKEETEPATPAVKQTVSLKEETKPSLPQVVLNNWKVGAFIGEGACGSVYEVVPVKATRATLNVPLVIKIIPLKKRKTTKTIGRHFAL